ncbi:MULTISPECIES: hypothetical protein [Clavibacter]|uniref:Uncharacterized protein n=1 Tax=Clavibacter tessellarius TaxID=31965 RepID=A0A154V1G6_9MICO|nr:MULTISPECIES: hypothetical protein [Clavibacter]KZC95181.1 hypothetical protein AWH51_09330 [Clavibacter michiganensis subsp. tessellarius]MDA3803811.1 hypothetical protein [Clavibacter sp. CT19]
MTSSSPALIRPRSALRALLRAPRLGSGIAIVGILAVVASLTCAPAPARASEAPMEVARAAISVSVDRGSYEHDLIAGRITPDEVVDVVIAGRAAGVPTSDRAELVRRATTEIAQLRRSEAAPAAPSTSPVSASASIWSHFKHWATLKVESRKLAFAGGGAAGGISAIAGTCFGFALFVCSAVLALAAGVALGLMALALSCIGDKQPYTYVKIPDVTNSHCGS